MKYLYTFLFTMLFGVAVLAQEPEEFDHSKYRQVKDAVQTVLVYTAKKYGGETYDEGKLKGFISDTSRLLADVKKEYPTLEYAVVGNTEINAPEQMAKGFMFVTTAIEYRDEKSTIQWEYNTVFGVNEVNFYSVQVDGKPKRFEDYYKWNELRKIIEEDKTNKSEQGL